MIDILTLIHTYSYVGISLVVFIESGIFFWLPGDSLLFTVGLLASEGYIQIYTSVACIVISAILGGEVGYIIGIYFDKLSHNIFFKKIFKEKYIRQTHTFFDAYGNTAIIAGRFVPIVRTITPILAGFGRMDKKLFRLYNCIGAVFWGVGIPMLGYGFGHVFPGLKDHISLISMVIIVISLFPVVMKIVRVRNQ